VMLDREISGAFNYTSGIPNVAIYRDTSERLGVAWPNEVRERCGTADLMLAVIGPNWLEARDQYARRRIDQSDDWVRQEIELALAGDKVLIPVIFGQSRMLPREALPESIADLADRRGVLVRDEFPNDLQPVLREIELHLPETNFRNVRSDIGGDRRKLPYPDPPLPIKPAPMTEGDIDIALHELLEDWEVIAGPLPENSGRLRIELYKEFIFHHFLDALKFMAEIADFADKANHHPRWENIYNTLRVSLTTWDIGHRISHLDVQLAQFFDRTYRNYCSQFGDPRESGQVH